ncbi:ParB family chromosome partitioning protein [Keratinibaculum paraultunense]|uniref:ParB family chromosome partitioning protein n=1 Tax=Keratinibaculum paraultunense TaxID=1278232 RepID=A0A4R3KQY9_9FIRM|nr:ParB/RepB/Spo0J family partition protein [Keratinibaculum paraultunense]QQY79751.1 ParB/RepB/Spo0J family partition protein [Keratinibaculum paraultunense]TCS86940.1 ParB family chromosome partitioning protein [Keratinibaculum paraultunense]
MVAKKRGLGKGLAALIPDEPIDDLLDEKIEDKSVLDIDIDLIEPNKYQPRQDFEKESLDELKDSIIQHGIIQPIIVRKKDNKYEIIAGERRWRAAKEAELKKVPCIVKEVDNKEAMKLALIENIQREDLNPIEEAYAFKGLMENYNLTQEEVAQAIGKSRSYIANSIRLLNLDDRVLNYIAEGKISSGHGRALLSLDNKEEQFKAANSIINNKMNVRDTEKLVKSKDKKKENREVIKKDPFVKEIEEHLMGVLGTKVNIVFKKSGGKIEIEFYEDKDLERILEIITN